MKKFIFIIMALFCGYNFSCHAQQDTVYVIFTSIHTDVTKVGIPHLKVKKNNPATFRYAPHYFNILSIDIYHFGFEYKNYTDEPDNPIIEKPVSFLSGHGDDVNWYDWDAIVKTVTTHDEAKVYVNKFLNADVLYFIDRNDIVDGKCYLIPVAKAGRRQYSSIVLE